MFGLEVLSLNAGANFMVKKLLLCLVLAMLMVSPAVSSEAHLEAQHYSIADIVDGKADLSTARFHMLELHGGHETYGVRGTMTLSGGRCSYWDGKAVQTVTEEARTFELVNNHPVISGDDGYERVYFLNEADGGLNGVNFSLNFPDDPSANMSDTLPNLRTTQQQLDSFVPYVEYVYSGDKVSGFMVRLVNSSNVSVPAVLDTNVRVELICDRVSHSGYIHLGTHGFYFGGSMLDFNAGETTEGTVRFIDNTINDTTEVNASDIVGVCAHMIVEDSGEYYEWTYYNPDWTIQMIEAHLVNGKSDYSRATFRELYLDVDKVLKYQKQNT